jgi:DNA-binding IscR family transcriptional regulator
VVDICEGGIALNHCLRKVDPCQRAGECKMSKVWATAQNAMTSALEKTTLADLT